MMSSLTLLVYHHLSPWYIERCNFQPLIERYIYLISLSLGYYCHYVRLNHTVHSSYPSAEIL